MKKDKKLLLSRKQINAAQMLASPEWSGNISQLCEEIGVSRTTYYRWLDDAQFKEYASMLVEKYADSKLSGVWKALIKKAETGDLSAIKLFFELQNKNKTQNDAGYPVVIFMGEDEIAD